MQYEIAHCRHATEGAISRLWYTMSWLEEKALLQAFAPPSDRASWQQEGQGEEAVARFQTHPHHLPFPGIELATYRIREPDDYSTLQDWGRHLALGSQVQVHAGWPIVCSRIGNFLRDVEGEDRVTLTGGGGIRDVIKISKVINMNAVCAVTSKPNGNA